MRRSTEHRLLAILVVPFCSLAVKHTLLRRISTCHSKNGVKCLLESLRGEALTLSVKARKEDRNILVLLSVKLSRAEEVDAGRVLPLVIASRAER